MKPILIKLIIVFLLAATIPSAQAGWFDRKEDPTQQRLVQVEQELTQQRKTNEVTFVLASILGVSCVVLLIVGAALGSKVRRHHHDHQS